MQNVEVQPLRLAEVELPDFHPEAPGTDIVYGFLVRDGPACILVDTGVGAGSDVIDRLYEPRRVELSDALATANVALGEITAVVNSHLHFDHCGNNALFHGVPIFVQQAELDAARQPHYTVPEWVDFEGAHYVPVRGGHALSEHVQLLPTPGHTPGHQSLLLRWGERTELVVGQAAYTAAEFQLFFERSGAPQTEAQQAAFDRCVQSNATWSREAYLESLALLHGTRPERAYFSHDPHGWTRGS